MRIRLWLFISLMSWVSMNASAEMPCKRMLVQVKNTLSEPIVGYFRSSPVLLEEKDPLEIGVAENKVIEIKFKEPVTARSTYLYYNVRQVSGDYESRCRIKFSGFDNAASCPDNGTFTQKINFNVEPKKDFLKCHTSIVTTLPIE